MGNFSRDTFNSLKHYVSVRLQQGVPIVDADWNEMDDIRRYELRAFLKWFVGDGVRYAHKDGVAWDYEYVDAALAPVYATSLALDSGGTPWISYWNSDTEQIRYAVRVKKNSHLT